MKQAVAEKIIGFCQVFMPKQLPKFETCSTTSLTTLHTRSQQTKASQPTTTHIICMHNESFSDNGFNKEILQIPSV